MTQLRALCLALPALVVVAGCFSRVAYPDGSTCTEYAPSCSDNCVVDSRGCQSCSCPPDYDRQHYNPGRP